MNDFWASVASIVDVIPKIVYFLFAALASGVDAMQCLVRKLAGLDSYTMGEETIANTDPLTEFVYGILGIGDSAYVYKGLNTVFWSLAIFGLIVLIVSTIVAIIKSHYSEDTEGTNVWKYIYTAIKSVLTFAIIPVVVVVGMMLSSFVLKTLDNITAGQVSESSIKGIYGANADQIFEGQQMEGNDHKSYSHYDAFGAALPTDSSTFGGMLFKASAYSCNRARTGDISYTNYQNIKYNGDSIFGNESCAAFDSLQTDAERAEYIAYQIDYAFMNCLELQDSLSYDTLVDTVGARQANWSDWFHLGNDINAFSKYSVSVVWQFYNLWTFNFIVAFGGGITIFGIFISIIVGLMTRLIKGAALFLVYPAFLGLAPLDNFKAFKEWVKSFMQQILMAIGSIVGLNLALVLLPYLQTISFFGQGHIDAIVNVVILIAGLVMAKDFISMVSGFVGGANAVEAGDGAKGNIASMFKQGAGIAGKAGSTVVKAGYHTAKGVTRVAMLPVSAAKNVVKKARRNHIAKDFNQRQTASSKAYDNYAKHLAEMDAKRKALEAKASRYRPDQKLESESDKAYKRVLKRTGSEEKAQEAKKEVLTKGILKKTGDWATYSSMGTQMSIDKYHMDNELAKQDILEKEFKDKAERYQLAKDASGKVSTTFSVKQAMKEVFMGKDEFDKEGKKVGHIQSGIFDNIGNAAITVKEGILKGVLPDMMAGTGVDKSINGLKELFKGTYYTKGLRSKGDRLFGENPKSEKKGDDLQKEIADKQSTKLDAQAEAMKKMANSISEVSDATKQQTGILTNIYSSLSNNNQNQGNNNSGGGNSDSDDKSK